MHKSHCCYATSALQIRGPCAYLHTIPKRQKFETKDETRNTMNLIRNYRNWRRYRETVSELNRLTTRELNDLGISRSDIPHVARRSV